MTKNVLISDIILLYDVLSLKSRSVLLVDLDFFYCFRGEISHFITVRINTIVIISEMIEIKLFDSLLCYIKFHKQYFDRNLFSVYLQKLDLSALFTDVYIYTVINCFLSFTIFSKFYHLDVISQY